MCGDGKEAIREIKDNYTIKVPEPILIKRTPEELEFIRDNFR